MWQRVVKTKICDDFPCDQSPLVYPFSHNKNSSHIFVFSTLYHTVLRIQNNFLNLLCFCSISQIFICLIFLDDYIFYSNYTQKLCFIKLRIQAAGYRSCAQGMWWRVARESKPRVKNQDKPVSNLSYYIYRIRFKTVFFLKSIKSRFFAYNY